MTLIEQCVRVYYDSLSVTMLSDFDYQLPGKVVSDFFGSISDTLRLIDISSIEFPINCIYWGCFTERSDSE